MIRVNNLHIQYKQDNQMVPAVRGVSFDINPGDYTAFIGPSGSGKSTLISALSGLIRPASGEIHAEKHKIHSASRSELSRIRARYFSIIFQFSEMLSRFTVRENLMLSWMAVHGSRRLDDFRERTEYLASRLDFFPLLDSFPGQLSGGQLQKTAIARALIRDLPVILADEPSGNLDPESLKKVKLLFAEEHEKGKTIFLVTHDMQFAFDAKTIFELRDGKIYRLVK